MDEALRSRCAIIGGQALSFWAYHYLIDELTGEEFTHLTSHDIDFLGGIPDVRRCAEAWHGRYVLPGPEDSTPNTGIVYVPVGGEEIAIDFLGHVYGVDDNELVRGLDEIDLGGTWARILTPVLCLKSRLNNLYGLRYGDQKRRREVCRIRVAIRAVNRYIADLLDEDQSRRAYDWSNALLNMAATDLGGRLFAEHGVDILAGIPLEHPAFDQRFRERHYPSQLEKVVRKREVWSRRVRERSPD